MHVTLSHAQRALVRSPFVARHICSGTVLRGTAVEAKRGAKALLELEDEKTEDAVEAELEWESPLSLKSIIKYPHPKLRAPNGRVKDFGEPLQKLTDEMFEVMYQDDGVGLAAPQVGVNLKLMVFNPAGERGKGEHYVLANPKIISTSKSTALEQEACLSFKNEKGVHVEGDVERPNSIKIKAQGVNGKRVKLSLQGWAARIFQHEYDHLDGVLFPDRMLISHLEREKDKVLALEEAYRKDYPGSTIVSVVSTRLAWHDAEDWKDRT